MADIEKIVYIIEFCGLFGLIATCITFIFVAVIKWLNSSDKRETASKINFLAGIAFVVLCIMLLVYFDGKESRGQEDNTGISNSAEFSENSDINSSGNGNALIIDNKDDDSATVFVRISKKAIGGLLFVIIVALIVVLLLIVIWCIKESICTLWLANSRKEIIETKSDGHNLHENKTDEQNSEKKYTVLIDSVRNSFVIPVIAGGIVSLFIILPFLAGEQSKGDTIEIWKDGIYKIGSLFDFRSAEVENSDTAYFSSVKEVIDAESNTGDTNNEVENNENGSDNGLLEAMASYTLLFIILLGVGFAVVKILCAFITQALQQKKNENLIDEYSSPIAFLAVGVAILLLIQKGDFPKEKASENIIELLKALGTVIFIAAIIILTLEIIRLLLDVKGRLIREEAKYLFISLVGKSTLLLLGILNSIYDAVNISIGNTVDTELVEIEHKLRRKIIKTMAEAMKAKRKSGSQGNIDNFKGKITFRPFNAKITKK